MVILDTILHKCPASGVEEICMGMAHRGRLNVLANFLQKSLKVIFTEFTENYIPDLVAGDGDVKYHLGYRTMRKLAPARSGDSSRGQSEPSRSGRSGGGRDRARPAAHSRRHRTSPESFAAADPRRRRFRGAGDRGGNAQHVAAARLRHRRHGARRREQSDRVHHAAGRCALVDVCDRHRQDDRGADFPCERRRPAGGHVRHRDWRSIFGRNSDATSSSTCIAIAATATTKGTNPSFTQPDLYAKIDKRPSVAQLYKRELLDRRCADAMTMPPRSKRSSSCGSRWRCRR